MRKREGGQRKVGVCCFLPLQTSHPIYTGGELLVGLNKIRAIFCALSYTLELLVFLFSKGDEMLMPETAAFG